MPIHFTCPHCGLTTDVDDQYAGQTVSCVQCKKPVTMPGTPPSGTAEPPKPRPGCRFTLVKVLVAVIVIGVLVALLLPAIETAREPARRAACRNNLKQIGLAMHAYHEKYGCFPPAYIPDENGKPMHSWRVLLLPFMEYKTLYNQYHFDEPWNGPHNMTLAELTLPEYRCPSDPSPPKPGITNYVMLVGPHAISDGPTGRRLADITDGTANTIMVVEVAGADINWLEPRDLDASKMTFKIGSPGRDSKPPIVDICSGHPSVANVLFCDGSVKSISKETDPKLLEAMTTIDGGETVDPDNLNRDNR